MALFTDPQRRANRAAGEQRAILGDMAQLNALSVRPALHLNGLAFSPMFQWLSHSVKAVSRSTPGTAVPLPNPAGWGTVSA